MEKQPKRDLKISDLSRLTGVPISTLRVWSEQGLITPEVSQTGYRIYNESHVKEVSDIKRLRTIQGLSIAAVKAILGGQTESPLNGFGQAIVDTPDAVGNKLRSLRQAAKYTIREVAEKTGISASVLGSIERTSLGVHIPEAKALATFYGVTLTSLMAGSGANGSSEKVTASSGGTLLPTLGKGLRIEQLATGRDMMDCQRWYVEPGIGSHGAYDHEGEEFVYVLLGEFEVTIEGDRVHRMRQGESIYFKSTWKHSWRNPAQTVCVLLWVNTPPSF